MILFSENKMSKWCDILKPGKKFVEFGDTVVVTDSKEHAKDVLREHGPFEIGTESADFSVMKIDKGWIVSCNHPDLLTFVSEKEVSPGEPDYVIGILGRGKRAEAAKKL